MNTIKFFKNVSILLKSDLQSEQIATNYKTIPLYFSFSWTPCYRCKTCKNWEIIFPLCLSLVGPLLENKIQFGAPQFKKEMEKLEMVQGEQRECLKGWKKDLWGKVKNISIWTETQVVRYSTPRAGHISLFWENRFGNFKI